MKLQGKLSLIVFVSGAIITLPGLFALYHLAKENYLEQELNQMSATTSANAAIPIDHIRRAESSLMTLATALKNSLAQPPREDEITEFDMLTSTDEFGVIRNKRALFDGSRQAGVFIPADVTITNNLKRTKLRAMKLLSIYGQSALQFYDGIWFDQADKTSVIFWRRDADFIYQLPPEHDYTQTLWNTLASPELNPKREPKWTPAIQESPVGTWVVSCVYPLDIHDQWIGVLGHDIALTELVNSFQQQNTYQHNQHFLLDAYGNFILAGPWQQQLEQSSGEFKPDLSHEPQLQALLMTEGSSSATNSYQTLTLQGQDYAAFTVLIPGLKWHYVKLVLINELLAPMQQLFINIAILIIFIAFLTAFLINRAMRRLVVKPVVNLARTAYDYAHGDYNRRFNYQHKNELGELARTFNLLADNVQQQQRALNKSHHKYQHLVNSLHEVIFKLDHKGHLRLMNTAWQTVTGYRIDDCLNHYLSDFIHPEFLLEIEVNVTALCNRDITSYHGEIKFITAKRQTIWLELELQASEEMDDNNQSQLVIAGNMADITERKYATLINQLIYEMDQQALQGLNLDQILTLSCIQLADALSLNLIWIADPTIQYGQVIASGGPDIIKLQDYVSQIFNTDTPTIFNSIQTISIRDELAGDGIAIPLRWPNDEHHAVIFFHAKFGYGFSEQDINRLNDLSHKIGITLQLAQDQKWMLLHRATVENTASAIMITDETGKIEWCNGAFSRLTGYQLNDIIGQSPSFLHAEQQDNEAYQTMNHHMADLKVWHGEIINRHKNGSTYYAVETITPLLDDSGHLTHFVAVQEDISDLKAAEEHMQHLATHDHLTGLPNRLLFLDRLDHAIKRATRNQDQHAIIFLDLDGFKHINDSLGHQTGDMILQQLAHRLNQLIRNSDTAARLGGDEFTILLECYRDINDVAQIADKVLALVNEPFTVQNQHLNLTTSIGISLFPHDGVTADELISHADAAMYHAKSLGRNNSQFFTSGINQKIQARLSLEQDMRSALVKNQFELHYQPQIDAANNAIIGMEALIRWLHPERGMVSPLDFIPFAEETGYIVKLGQWVLETACTQAKTWQQQGYAQLTVSVNISAIQLVHADFISMVKHIVQQTQVNPEQVIIELTESIMLSQPEQAIALLHELKKIGFKLSIDDFGTGYSSLQYLKMLPLDELKIDQSFIRDIDQHDGYAIVNSICALGNSMGLSLIAEGVEKSDTPAKLHQLGCDHCQGYYYSKPLTVEDATHYLKTYHQSA